MKISCYLLFIFIALSNKVQSQNDTGKPAPVQSEASKATPQFAVNNNLTITYNLLIDGNKKTGIEEVYNGGNRTIFINNKQVRVRLVSLMRIESLFFLIGADTSLNKIVVVKESGKDKYKNVMPWSVWKASNNKYEGLQYKYLKDTLTILKYHCKKVIIKLRDGKEIVAYYTNELNNPILANVDVAFAEIPGVVLQYQYKHKGKSITYSASEINTNKISAAIFKIPATGFAEKKL